MKRRESPDAILGLISGLTLNIWFMHSVFNLFKNDHENRFGADWLLVFGPYIHQSRNQLQQEFLATDREWLFMVDNDMVFEPDDVWVLFDEARERGPGIYSAAYLLEDSTLVSGPWDDKIPMAYHRMIGLPVATCQVGVVGSGFTLVHRDVFTAIGDRAFLPVAPDTGEDVSFAWRAREVGYTPWVVPKSDPGHAKSVVLFPSGVVRNSIGEDVNLVQVDEDKKVLEDGNVGVRGTFPTV